MPIGHAQARKTSEARTIFRARTFYLVKKKNSYDPQISSQKDKTIKKLQWIPNPIGSTSVLIKYNILMFTYLMMSKMSYLLMDWETFS